MSGYFSHLAARALGEPEGIAPAPKLRFAEGPGVDPKLPARDEATIVREQHQPAPARSDPTHVVMPDPAPREAQLRPVPVSAGKDLNPPQVTRPALTGGVQSAPDAEPPMVRLPEREPVPPARPHGEKPHLESAPAEVVPPPSERPARREELPAPPPRRQPPEPRAVARQEPRREPPPRRTLTLAPVLPRPESEGRRWAIDPPQVTITIGQIELRAAAETKSPPAPAIPPARERPRKPGLSLEQYLEQRSRR